MVLTQQNAMQSFCLYLLELYHGFVSIIINYKRLKLDIAASYTQALVKMEINDISELNALHKLLVTIKTQDSLDSADVDGFACSGLINQILVRLQQEFIEKLRKEHPDQTDKWFSATNTFAVDSEMGKAIKKRISNWDSSIVDNLVDKSPEFFIDLAKSYIIPFDSDNAELQKLADFISQRVKGASV